MNRISFILILVLWLSLPLFPASYAIGFAEWILPLVAGSFLVLAVTEGIRSN